MDIRQIKESFSRVKIYYAKKDNAKAFSTAATALREALKLPGGLTTELKGATRELVTLLSKDDYVKKVNPNLAYKPGDEKNLLALFTAVHQQILKDQGFESYDDTRARKLALDQKINAGIKLLEQGKISEADESFQESLKFYKDEHRVFLYISRLLIAAGQIKRSLTYIKRGLEINNKDPELVAVFRQVRELLSGGENG